MKAIFSFFPWNLFVILSKRNFLIKLNILFLIHSLVTFSNAFSDTQKDLKFTWENAFVKEIKITGLWRMEDNVVRRELTFAPGDKIDSLILEKNLQRIRNLRTVHQVEASVVLVEKNQAIVTLDIGEKWAIIPVTRFGGGGGSAFFVLGVYDVNFLGKYLELGGQYINYNNIHGGEIWYRDPRLDDKHQSLYIALSSEGKPQSVYETKKGSNKVAPTIEIGAFIRRANQIKIEYFSHLNDFFGLGVDYSVATLAFPSEGLTAEQRAINERFHFKNLRKQNRFVQSFKASAGRIDFNDYLAHGTELVGKITLSRSQLFTKELNPKASLQFQTYYLAPKKQNLAMRLTIGTSSKGGLLDQFYIGGIDAVRGFFDGEFQGRRAWTANLEYRIPSLQTPYVVLQHIAFLDAGNAAQDWSQVFPLNHQTPLSTGTGLRFIVPKIARFNVRADLSWTLQHRRGYGIVFGMQQFF